MSNSPAVQKIIDVATAEVGYHEGHSGGSWNNVQKYSPAVPGLEWSQGQSWCATFVSWVAMTAGQSAIFPRTASCDTAAAWFKGHKRWSDVPTVGAQVFYGTAADLTHTGVVVGFDAVNITTVEGNTNANGSREGDGVYRKVRRRRDAFVVGYGHPAYPVAPPQPVKVTRVTQARALLVTALAKANAARAKAIRAALAKLPVR